MKILITGNLGYVGSTLVPFLAERHSDLDIVGVDSGLFAHCVTQTGPLPEVALKKQFYADVREVPADAFHAVDAIIHLGAVSNDPMGDKFAGPTREINFEAGKKISLNARKAGVSKFIFASSCSVYGIGQSQPKEESDIVGPLTAYAKSKVDLEQHLEEIASEFFQVTALRFATACGFSPRFRTDLVLNDFVHGAITRGVIPIFSDGTPWRPLIHVYDMCRAIEWAIFGEQAVPFIAVNTGSDEWNYQVYDLALAVNEALPAAKIEINPNGGPDLRSYRVNFSKFQHLAPLHQPIYSLERAIAEMVIEISNNKESFPCFTRGIKRLTELQDLVNLSRLSRDLRWTEN